MKLIFLDIDGVLNSAKGKGPYLADMEIEKLELLKKLINDTNAAGIVLISDRRYSSIYMKEFIETLDKYEIYMVGELRKPKELEEDPNDNRGKQIMDYIDSSNDFIDRIIILDDNDDGISSIFKEELLIVNRFDGLNEEIYKKAVTILNG